MKGFLGHPKICEQGFFEPEISKINNLAYFQNLVAVSSRHAEMGLEIGTCATVESIEMALNRAELVEEIILFCKDSKQ